MTAERGRSDSRTDNGQQSFRIRKFSRSLSRNSQSSLNSDRQKDEDDQVASAQRTIESKDDVVRKSLTIDDIALNSKKLEVDSGPSSA